MSAASSLAAGIDSAERRQIQRTFGADSPELYAAKPEYIDSELVVFEGCAHAPIYENVEEFNQRTMGFLRAHPARWG
jgi:pimeloyl-ACP methyl ester carboxylesterase